MHSESTNTIYQLIPLNQQSPKPELECTKQPIPLKWSLPFHRAAWYLPLQSPPNVMLGNHICLEIWPQSLLGQWNVEVAGLCEVWGNWRGGYQTAPQNGKFHSHEEGFPWALDPAYWPGFGTYYLKLDNLSPKSYLPIFAHGEIPVPCLMIQRPCTFSSSFLGKCYPPFPFDH